MTKAEIENDETDRPEGEAAGGAPTDAAAAAQRDAASEAAEAELTDLLEEEAAALAAEADEVGEPARGVGDLAKLVKEIAELNDRHLRLAAEFNNYRRRSEQQRLESWSRAQADLVTRFIDVVDDLHRVAQMDLSNATVEGIMAGIDLVEKKFMRVLEEAGVQVIDPVGAAFDPERMEAMMRVPAESEEQDDHVAQVFAKGYTLDGILVRPARVSVHKVD